MKFCHITPVDHLDLVKGREAHLTLAHIVSGMEGAFSAKMNAPTTITESYLKKLIREVRDQ